MRISPIRPLRRVTHGRESLRATNGTTGCEPGVGWPSPIWRHFPFQDIPPKERVLRTARTPRLSFLCGLPLPSAVVSGFNGTMGRPDSSYGIALDFPGYGYTPATGVSPRPHEVSHASRSYVPSIPRIITCLQDCHGLASVWVTARQHWTSPYSGRVVSCKGHHSFTLCFGLEVCLGQLSARTSRYERRQMFVRVYPLTNTLLFWLPG